MKTILIVLSLSFSTIAAEPAKYLTTLNAEVAKAAFASYKEGHFRFIQDARLLEAYEVDERRPSCIVEAGKMTFNTDSAYVLESTRSLDVDGGEGEIELNFETKSADPDAYFQIYCFQDDSSTSLETAREGLKEVFEIK